MILTSETFTRMVKNIRAIYGPNWRSDLDTDKEAQIQFFQNCQEIIPDEMADVFITVYRTHRDMGPRSPYDIVKTYIEKQLEDAKSSDFIIDKIVSAIRDYEYSENEPLFADCDDYLLNNVIPVLPCPDGIKAFYLRNKRMLKDLALHAPDQFEQATMYNKLEKDYREQLTITARKAVIRRINYNALSSGEKQTNNQLEG